MSGFKSNVLPHGQLRLSAAEQTDTAEAGTYVKVAGTFTDGFSKGFEIADNKIIWRGPDNTVFLLNGVSDVSVNKASTITYGLFLNDTLVPGAETPHTFAASAKISNISITAFVSLNTGDELDVYVKSDTLDTEVSVSTLIITLIGAELN